MRNLPSSGQIVTVALTAITSLSLAYCWHRKTVQQLTKEWQNRRQEERTGRIRAEVRLRTVLKEQQQQSQANTKDGSTRMVLNAIGTVVSPYTKRMGTPRQPQLVPSSRGYIQLNVPAASLCGIDEYSHIWVIFEFHANTNIDKKRTKIRPPRAADNVKVGQLATRSPHRPNALGLSLIKLERWDETTRQLYVSGLDLVNGTPVYDIKPCVPWDVPGYPDHNASNSLRVPSWVEQQDSIAKVEFCATAATQLQEMVSAGRLAPLYTDSNDGYVAAMQTLQQVLAQDPRSSHKGLKTNARGSKSTGSYKLIFGQCQVEFVVADSGVQVTQVAAINFDPNSYVDGVPLISESSF